MPNKPCLKIGITGGIGSGKTTVCKLFEALGIPVYYADHEAKLLMVNDLQVRAKIVAAFGEAAYLPDGSLHRKHLADVIFQDDTKRQTLNSIVHPAVLEHGRVWHETQCAQGAPFTLKEAALLIESGSYRDLDLLILVTAPQQVRIKRVRQRDGLSTAEIRQRMKSQLTDKERRKYAQMIIQNDGKVSLIPQVWTIYQKLVYR